MKIIIRLFCLVCCLLVLPVCGISESVSVDEEYDPIEEYEASDPPLSPDFYLMNNSLYRWNVEVTDKTIVDFEIEEVGLDWIHPETDPYALLEAAGCFMVRLNGGQAGSADVSFTYGDTETAIWDFTIHCDVDEETNVFITMPLQLPYTAGTGYEWHQLDNEAPKLIFDDYAETESDMLGAAGYQAVKFPDEFENTINPVVLTYNREWENESPAAYLQMFFDYEKDADFSSLRIYNVMINVPVEVE